MSTRYSHKLCPSKKISKKSYTYIKKSTGKTVKVKATCVKSKGLRSRGIYPNRNISKLSHDDILKYNYGVHKTKTERHSALKDAIKEYGYASLVRKLNAVRILNKNTNPKNSEVYHSDMLYLQKKYRPAKSMKKSRRRRS